MPLARPLTLHVVEDHAAVRSALQLLTRCFGWQAQTYESGPQFLDAQLGPVKAACVVLDLNLCGMDGEEVLRRLRVRRSQLPVLVITGDRVGARLDWVRRLGAHYVQQKPFGDDAFHAAVEAACAAAGRAVNRPV